MFGKGGAQSLSCEAGLFMLHAGQAGQTDFAMPPKARETLRHPSLDLTPSTLFSP